MMSQRSYLNHTKKEVKVKYVYFKGKMKMLKPRHRFLAACTMIATVSVAMKTEVVTTTESDCPVSFCVCHSRKKASCMNHGTKLDYIPSLPDSVEFLVFVGNFLPNITMHTFANVSSNNIRRLNLTQNGIRTISSDAFSDFKSMYMLDLSSNSRILPDMLTQSFKSVYFSAHGSLHLNNVFSDIKMPENLFHRLAGSYLENIYLRHNNLLQMSGKWFEGLDSLTLLDVSNNNMVETQLEGLHKLSKLSIDHNNLKNVPNFCFMNKSSFTPRLQFLGMTRNQIKYLRTSDFECVGKLVYLYIFNNPVTWIHNNVFAPLRKIHKLHMNFVSYSLEHIDSYAFNFSNVKQLSLANARFRFKQGTFDPDTIFRFCPRLETLILSYNNVPYDSETVIKMFGPLRNLKRLILQSVGWRAIPGDVFHRMESLKVLELGENNIHSPSLHNPFASVKSLSTLGLDGNKINTIETHSMPENIIGSLKTLDLSNNPFLCNCDLLWFVSWLNRTKIEIRSYPNLYQCVMPKLWQGKNLNTFSEDCANHGNIRIKIIAATCSGAFVIVLITTIVIYKTRWHIRYWIYLLRSRHKSYIRLNSSDYLYAGFVVYCDTDRKWVHEKLVPFLEDEHGHTLCIHYRDFQVGKLIVDNIVDSMNVSRKVVLVMSNAFARSEWCQFEVLLAHKRLLKNKNEILVTVLLEEVNSKQFTNALKLILTSTTYAAWSEEEIGQRLFWNQLLSSFNSDERPDYNSINA